jgi:hypothetical protein
VSTGTRRRTDLSLRPPRGRRSDNEVEGAERLDEPAREPRGTVLVARVQVHLTAARLLFRYDDLVTQPLQHLGGGARRSGEDRVAHAGGEQRYPHGTPPLTCTTPARVTAADVTGP